MEAGDKEMEDILKVAILLFFVSFWGLLWQKELGKV